MPVGTRSHISPKGLKFHRQLDADKSENIDECVATRVGRRHDPVGVLKEQMNNVSFSEKPLKASHASISLLGQTRRYSAFRIQDEHQKPAEMMCDKIESSSVKNIKDRPILPGIEFACHTDMKPACRDEAINPRSAMPFSTQRCKPSRPPSDLLQEGCQTSRIMVYVRLRPLSKKEKEAGARSCVRIVNKKDVYLTEFALETDYLRLKRLRGRHFAFDAAFTEHSGQQEVYNTSTAELVEAVLQGRNASVFCYGATGAGKTHTMLGTLQQPGVMVLALKDLFAKLKQKSRDGDYMVRLSYLEVYNESVRDLLSPGRPLILREDSKQGIIAAGLTQYQAYSAEEVMVLLQKGNQNRQTEPTRINETSSRSHAILQVVAEYKVKHDGGSVSRVGKLSLIDLAGSERALATDQRTLRSVEGANINRSLLALSSCINALVEGKSHIPFRNSKLTQLLKDSLGGACQTAMIANISPGNLSFGETQNTLHWADRAKEIRTKICQNEELEIPNSQEDQTIMLLRMQKENQQLRFQLARLQQKYLAIQNCNPSTNVSPCREDMIQPLSAAPSPFTPHHKSPRYASTPRKSPMPKCQDRAAEKTIKELQRTVSCLEKEAEKLRLEAMKKEQNLAVAISNLNRQHSLQLKQKDDFIKKLCQRTNSASPVVHKLLSPLVNSPKRRSNRKADDKASNKSAARPNDASSPSNRFYSPAKLGKKRSFWDISSPSTAAAKVPSTRSNNSTPSMLLQPGFARHR